MAHGTAHLAHPKATHAGLLAVLGAALLLGGCASTSDLLPQSQTMASAEQAGASDPSFELRKATEYWGKEYASKPADKTAAVSYAKNLKALGDKRQALNVLQAANAIHQRDPEIAGELGRLALEFDQLSLASRALEVADVPDRPDWKVISARGTVLAKQGQHKAAIPYFERALALAPNQPSVMNNLAMATAMSGNAQKAEEILRSVAQQEGAPGKVNQNLALVLGLQGKYEESKAAGSVSAPSDVAAANTDYLRRMVRLDPKMPAPGAAVQSKTEVARAATPAAQAAAFKPASIENTPGNGWNTAVTASAEPAPGFKGSKR